MSTDHLEHSKDDKFVPPAWVEGSWAKPAQRKSSIKFTALAAWLAEYFVVRGRDLAMIAVVFGLAGLAAGILWGEL